MNLMLNKKVLMSSAKYFSANAAINPYYQVNSVDTSLATKEHELIRQTLRDSGVEVVSVDAPTDSQDGVYAANWALVRGDTAILARLPHVRRAEEAWAEAQLQKMGYKVVHVPNDWRFSGQGDALACGNYLFCGRNYRSDERAQEFAAKTLGYDRIQLECVPLLDDNKQPVINKVSGWQDSFYYDIDLALAIIRPPQENPASPGLIAYCPEAFTPESQSILANLTNIEKIIVSEHEAKSAFACNLVSTGHTVIMSQTAPQLQSDLEVHGLKIKTPAISELAKGGGYIRCTSLQLAH